MTRLKTSVSIAVLALALPVYSLAQNAPATTGNAPAGQTASGPVAASTEDTPVQGRQTYEPETTPLSGSQLLGFGLTGESLNMLNIGISVHEQADSNAFAIGTDSRFRSVTTFLGDVDLNRMWKRNSFNLHYNGGGSLYTNSDLNNTTHSLGAVQSLSWQRWTLRLGDEFSYSPYSPYGIGLGGFGFAYLYGNGNLVLHPGEIPDQSVFSTRSSRLGNTVFSNLDYSFSRRTAVTLSGSYGVLHFKDAAFYDSNQYGGGIGLSHQLTGHDSISANYSFRQNEFSQLGTMFSTHTTELRYGRRITGRLGLEAWGGPEINYFDSGPSVIRHIYGSGGLSLKYRTRATDYFVGYDRGVRSGSGILVGSLADSVTAGVGQSFGRQWSANVSGGYSRNRGLIENSEFNSASGGVFLRRTLGRYSGLGFNYALQRQTASCSTTGNCPAYTRQIIGVSFDWRMKPIRLGE